MWRMPREAHAITDETLRVVLASGIGPVTYSRFLESIGGPDRIVRASTVELASCDGIGRSRAESIRRAIDEVDPAAERTAMAEQGVRMIVRGVDDDFPPLLASIYDPPVALWLQGELREDDRLAVAIVGSRRCTTYGREQSGRFSALLAQSGLTIISGGAVGIDGEAHRGALRVNGRTIAILGCGLANRYPPQHEDLFSQIVHCGGALISEYPMRTEPRAEHFPSRNRIISGLSLGVLVIEAANRSGALITARLAAEEHHREVMALPGRIDSPASAGCLRAIQEGWAALVVNHADVLRQLESVAPTLLQGAIEAGGSGDAMTPRPSLFDGQLTEPQQSIVNVLNDAGEAILIDTLAARTQLPLNQLMAELTLLEIRRRIVREGQGVRLRP
jgi:DNA processing protein